VAWRAAGAAGVQTGPSCAPIKTQAGEIAPEICLILQTAKVEDEGLIRNTTDDRHGQGAESYGKAFEQMAAGFRVRWAHRYPRTCNCRLRQRTRTDLAGAGYYFDVEFAAHGVRHHRRQAA